MHKYQRFSVNSAAAVGSLVVRALNWGSWGLGFEPAWWLTFSESRFREKSFTVFIRFSALPRISAPSFERFLVCRDDQGHWFRSGSPLTNYPHAPLSLVLWFRNLAIIPLWRLYSNLSVNQTLADQTKLKWKGDGRARSDKSYSDTPMCELLSLRLALTILSNLIDFILYVIMNWSVLFPHLDGMYFHSSPYCVRLILTHCLNCWDTPLFF